MQFQNVIKIIFIYSQSDFLSFICQSVYLILDRKHFYAFMFWTSLFIAHILIWYGNIPLFRQLVFSHFSVWLWPPVEPKFAPWPPIFFTFSWQYNSGEHIYKVWRHSVTDNFLLAEGWSTLICIYMYIYIYLYIYI